MGDFNAEYLSNNFQGFCEPYNWKSLIKKPKCFKNPDNSTCTDLIWTDKKNLKFYHYRSRVIWFSYAYCYATKKLLEETWH